VTWTDPDFSPMDAMVANIRRVGQWRMGPWWTLMPLRKLADAERHKLDYVTSGLHGLYGLRGFQCIGRGFGQTHTFTYDSEAKEWNR
jgi:hypothetical protein